VENVISLYTQRVQRRAQLEAEMSQCQLPGATQAQIRRMLAQKESNYLRLRRAKMDRLPTLLVSLTPSCADTQFQSERCQRGLHGVWKIVQFST